MLTPAYLEKLPDPIIDLYTDAELKILSDMARRIVAVGEVTATAQYQLERLQAMGATYEEILTVLSRMTKQTEKELKQLFLEASSDSAKIDDQAYAAAGKTPIPIQESPQVRGIMQAGMQNTMGLFKNLTRTTATTGQRQFIRVMDQVWMQLATGAFDYKKIIESAIKELAQSGLGAISYPSGHIDSMETAVRRAALTGIHQTTLKMQDTRMDEMDCEFVETSAHAGARNKGSGPANHEQWQGKVYCRKGNTEEYPDFRQSTGYGTGEGLGGWNCRHDYFAFYPGISQRVYTDESLQKMREQTVNYNGQSIPLYQATQEQRQIERKIRRWKREAAMMEAAGLDPAFAKGKIREWEKKQRDFINQTGLTRQYDREKLISPLAGVTKSDILKVQVKDIHIKGMALFYPDKIDTSEFSFSDVHINADRGHNLTKEEAQRFIDQADIAFSRWNGNVLVYVSDAGCAIVNLKDREISTAYKKEEFDRKFKKLREVMQNDPLSNHPSND